MLNTIRKWFQRREDGRIADLTRRLEFANTEITRLSLELHKAGAAIMEQSSIIEKTNVDLFEAMAKVRDQKLIDAQVQASYEQTLTFQKIVGVQRKVYADIAQILTNSIGMLQGIRGTAKAIDNLERVVVLCQTAVDDPQSLLSSEALS